jgi:alpha-mannosidase
VDGRLEAEVPGNGMRSYALSLNRPRVSKLAGIVDSTPLELPYNHSVATNDGEMSTGGFDASGRCLAAEMLPYELRSAGVDFKLGPGGAGQRNAMSCHEQKIRLPEGRFNRLYLLMASSPADQEAVLKVNGRAAALKVQDWGGFLGQWDKRGWEGEIPELAFEWPYKLTGLTPGYIKRDPVAWFCSHRHNGDGRNDIYEYSYLYRYAIELQPGDTSITLPHNPSIQLMAASAAWVPNPGFKAAQPLYDTLDEQTSMPLLTMQP